MHATFEAFEYNHAHSFVWFWEWYTMYIPSCKLHCELHLLIDALTTNIDKIYIVCVRSFLNRSKLPRNKLMFSGFQLSSQHFTKLLVVLLTYFANTACHQIEFRLICFIPIVTVVARLEQTVLFIAVYCTQ